MLERAALHILGVWMEIAIIGAGLIGRKRALAAKSLGHAVSAICDSDFAKAKALASEFGAAATANADDALSAKGVDAAIICTTHNSLSSLSCAALAKGLHVLVEKPAGRNSNEIKKIILAQKKSGKIVRVGFNHRFHPAIQKAKGLCSTGGLGPIMYVRGRYGHGGRLGYEKEWRASKEISGGGELLDQGSHLIDLSRLFLGGLSLHSSLCKAYFWKMPVEDNAFLLLQSKRGQAASLHASWSEWKNLFSFEISCERALLRIEGLGGSYGKEKLTIYRMKPTMGIPDEEKLEFDSPDKSFELELLEFAKAAEGKENAKIGATLDDALASMSIVEAAYEANAK